MKRRSLALLSFLVATTLAFAAAPSYSGASEEDSSFDALVADEPAPPAVPDGDLRSIADGPARPATGLSEAERDELYADARAYAEEHGVTTQQAEDTLSSQASLSRLATSVKRSIDGDRIAGISISHSPQPRLHVRLTPGPIPESLLESMDAEQRLVVTTDARMSLAGRTRASTALVDDWAAAIPSLDGWYIDEASDRIVLLVVDDDDIKRARELARTDELLSEGERSGGSSRALEFTIEKTHPTLAENKGGRDLRSCTIGFVVKQSGERPGFLTAGHCSTPQPWFFFSGGSGHPTSVVWRSYNAYRDMAFYRINPNQPIQAKPFVYRASESEDIAQRRNVLNVQGEYACHRGQGSGFSCGDIESVNYAPTHGCSNNGCSPRWVSVTGRTLRSDGGDSGGPWFIGLSPAGIHNGSNIPAGGDRAVYSKLGNAPSGMTIWVK